MNAVFVCVCHAGGEDRLADPIDTELLMEALPAGVVVGHQVKEARAHTHTHTHSGAHIHAYGSLLRADTRTPCLIAVLPSLCTRASDLRSLIRAVPCVAWLFTAERRRVRTPRLHMGSRCWRSRV